MKTTSLSVFWVVTMFFLGSCASTEIPKSESPSSLTPTHQAQTPPTNNAPANNTPNNIRIIPMSNPAQRFELAAKLQWNPHNRAWDKVLVLYNGNQEPPQNHPVWAYLNNIIIPQRSANSQGENLYYKAFHSYNYCTGETALTHGTHLQINFDNNSSGPYTKADFSKDWNCPSWQMGRHLVNIVGGSKAHRGKSLQLNLLKGSSGCGTDCINWKPLLGGKFNKITYSYWIKFPNNFDFVLGGKLPGIGSRKSNTGGKRPNGYDGWSIRSMWNRHGKLGQYVYHMDQKDRYGEFIEWNMPPISKGQWHHIQTTVQLNTPKQANGLIQTLVNGRMVLNRQDIRFRMITGLEVERFLFSSFFGGNGKQWAPHKDEALYIDDINIKK